MNVFHVGQTVIRGHQKSESANFVMMITQSSCADQFGTRYKEWKPARSYHGQNTPWETINYTLWIREVVYVGGRSNAVGK